MKRTLASPLTAAFVAVGLITAASIATPAAAHRGKDDAQRHEDRGGRREEAQRDKDRSGHGRSGERARIEDRSGTGQGRGRGRGRGRGGDD